jgi:hypothetical protein
MHIRMEYEEAQAFIEGLLKAHFSQLNIEKWEFAQWSGLDIYANDRLTVLPPPPSPPHPEDKKDNDIPF